MPVYPHVCRRCERTEDRFYQSFDQMTAEPAPPCLVCNGRMERVPTAPAFKVNGFAYANGYSGNKS